MNVRVVVSFAMSACSCHLCICANLILFRVFSCLFAHLIYRLVCPGCQKSFPDGSTAAEKFRGRKGGKSFVMNSGVCMQPFPKSHFGKFPGCVKEICRIAVS